MNEKIPFWLQSTVDSMGAWGILGIFLSSMTGIWIKVWTLCLELGLGAGLSDFINMPQYLLFKEKAKHYWCYLEFSQIISKNNKYEAGEKSKNLECDNKMGKMNKGVFLRISNDECIEQEWIQGTALTQLTSNVNNGQQAVLAPHLSKGNTAAAAGTLLQSMIVRILTVQIQKIQLKLLKQNSEIIHISENSPDHPPSPFGLTLRLHEVPRWLPASLDPQSFQGSNPIKKKKKKAFPPSNSWTHIT